MRQCQHEDALLLSSLFPNGAPAALEEIVACFLSRRDDPRCLVWAVMCGGSPCSELFRESSERECAFGHVIYIYMTTCPLTAEEKGVLLERAAAETDPLALYLLGHRLWTGEDVKDVKEDRKRAEMLWRQGAELGDAECQFRLGELCCPADSLQSFLWIRRSAMQKCGVDARHYLSGAAIRVMVAFDEGKPVGLSVFNLGAACADTGRSYLKDMLTEARQAVKRAVGKYKHWRGQAERAVMCWIWLSRHRGSPGTFGD